MEADISIGKRFISGIIDYVIFSVIAVIAAILGFILSASAGISENSAGIERNVFLSVILLLTLVIAVSIAKDSLNGRSFGKRITGFVIVDIHTHKVASPVKCFVRNLFVLLWPIELIMIIINPQRRIGDYVAGTILVNHEPLYTQRASFKNLFPVFFLMVVFVFMIYIPIAHMPSLRSFKTQQYAESSYNRMRSDKMSRLFSDSMSAYISSSDIHIYNTAKDSEKRYALIILYLNNNYHTYPQVFNKIDSMVIHLIHTEYTAAELTGQVKYIYKKSGDSFTEIEPIE